jgi:HAD superfamily hydrolase (TIGR01459 family)
MNDIPLLTGVRALALHYDAFVLDLWGVLHNGERPYPGVRDCLAVLRQHGKTIVLLSNAPRRARAVEPRLREIGFEQGSYDDVMTSGEDVWRALQTRGAADAEPFYRDLGARGLHLGPERDQGLYEGAPISRTVDVEACDFALCTGLDGAHETPADYEVRLRRCIERGAPLICANPDLHVVRGTTMEYCAGALAQRYEELGGVVRWHGKPYAPVYISVRRMIDAIAGRTVETRRILCVGDSLRTDIAGAAAAGLDSLLVAGGIHADEFGAGPDRAPDAGKIAAACAAARLRPVAATASFRW